MPIWMQLSLQDSNSPIMENMIIFYDYAMLIIMMILSMIMYMFIYMFLNKFINRFLFKGQLIEMIWTIIPMIFLIFLAIPSLKVLYLSDEMYVPDFNYKCIGHQWYWSYECNDFNLLINFDSFMINDYDNNQMFRLLDVDNRLILPMQNEIRLLITSYDVIHSFTLPSTGIKVDAVPGRINQINLNLNRPGLYYGQCSEICGVNHSFMPIVIESINLEYYFKWLMNN